jgi:hypothetical protein
MGECWHRNKICTCGVCREEERDALSETNSMMPTCVRVACATAMQRARACTARSRSKSRVLTMLQNITRQACAFCSWS